MHPKQAFPVPTTSVPALAALARKGARRGPRRSGTTSSALVAVVLATVVSAGCTAGTAGTSDASTGAAADPSSSLVGIDGTSSTIPGDADATPAEPGTDQGDQSGSDGEAPDDPTEDALDADDDSEGFGDDAPPQPEPPAPVDPVDDGPVDLDPVDQPAAGPCDSLPNGSSLLVQPDPLVLQADRMKGALTITNCSDGDVGWTAATKPSVSLDIAGANLLPGQSQQLAFVIDDSAWDPGAIEFKIKVSEPGANHYVDVHAYDTVFGGEAVAGNGQLSAGEGVGGCGDQCITSAWLTPNLSTPNVSLAVRTNTPATMQVWVSTSAPEMNDGVPSFGALAPMATSAAGQTEWSAMLEPLQPATEYHLIVSATDADGDIAHRWTTFTTLTPVDGPGDLASPDGPGGCGAQCITSAVVTPSDLTPDDDSTDRHLAVASHTPARFQVSVGLNAPAMVDGRPQLDGSVFWANSGEQYTSEWNVDLTDLAPGTVHHVVVTATDAEGRNSYRTGQFQTPAAAVSPTAGTLVTLHRIDVTYDGDAKDWNRGEVSWMWGFEGIHVASWGERKMRDGDVITFDTGNTYDFIGIGDYVPTAYVNSAERDADGWVEFCDMGFGPYSEPTTYGSCDVGINVAATGDTTDAGIAAMPRCIDLDIDSLEGMSPDARCTWIESTVGHGYDTEFRALISYQVHD